MTKLARAASMAKEYADSPVAFVGVASPASAGAAGTILKKYGVSFPNCVDKGGLTFALYGVSPTTSYGFVIDEEGKIVYSCSLSTYLRGSPGVAYFAHKAKPLLEDARDPFGIDSVPEAGRQVYDALKFGQFEIARAYARKLKGSRNAELKAFAEKVIKAVEEREKSHRELMKTLAEEGRVGELEAEIDAFQLAFPRAKKSELRRLVSGAKRNGDGKQEALAAANFKRAAALFAKGSSSVRSQAKILCRAVAGRYQDTYYGRLAQILLDNWPKKK